MSTSSASASIEEFIEVSGIVEKDMLLPSPLTSLPSPLDSQCRTVSTLKLFDSILDMMNANRW